MRQQDIINIEMKYLSMFSKKIPTRSGFIFADEHQKDKYAHNFMMITKEPFTSEELINYEDKQKDYGFVIYRIENEIPFEIPNYDIENYGYFHAKITDLKIESHRMCDISILNPSDQSFFQFMYEEDLEFGESYAKGNIKRQKEVLEQNEKQFFYIKLVYEDLVIGNLNAVIDGKYAKIDEFYVKKVYQRQGFGTELMYFMIQYLQKRGVDEVYLVTDLAETAQHLYKRFGFTHVGSYRQYKRMFPRK